MNYGYADDRILIKFGRPDRKDNLIAETVQFIEQHSLLMGARCLKLNPTKTNFMWVASPQRQHLIENLGIRLSSRTEITPSKNITVLGVVLDNALSMEPQIADS